MKRSTIYGLATLCILLMSAAFVWAGDPPTAAPPQQGLNQGQPPVFYGYVPPPPVRHTWPGGYKVIFHELTNTLIEHILGQY